MKPRGTVTNKLTDVIQVLQLARKTGLLTIQRDAGNNLLEQGTITFHEGQVIDAHVGQLKGEDAFKNSSAGQPAILSFNPHLLQGFLRLHLYPLQIERRNRDIDESHQMTTRRSLACRIVSSQSITSWQSLAVRVFRARIDNYFCWWMVSALSMN